MVWKEFSSVRRWIKLKNSGGFGRREEAILSEHAVCFVSHTALLMHCRDICCGSATLNLEFSLLVGRWGQRVRSGFLLEFYLWFSMLIYCIFFILLFTWNYCPPVKHVWETSSSTVLVSHIQNWDLNWKRHRLVLLRYSAKWTILAGGDL